MFATPRRLASLLLMLVLIGGVRSPSAAGDPCASARWRAAPSNAEEWDEFINPTFRKDDLRLLIEGDGLLGGHAGFTVAMLIGSGDSNFGPDDETVVIGLASRIGGPIVGGRLWASIDQWVPVLCRDRTPTGGSGASIP